MTGDDTIQQLMETFMKFPGIGPRQARRFVYYLLRSNHNLQNKLIDQIKALRQGINQCPDCFRFFSPFQKSSTLCRLCQDQNRDQGLLMIVEKDTDLENMERARIYNGHYFILGGNVPILDKTPEQHIRLRELTSAIEKRTKNLNLKEIILALSATTEGDYTADFLRQYLTPVIKKYKLTISMLGRGLSTGTELEYSDTETLKNALRHRE